MHDCIKKNLPKRLSRDRKAVLSKDLALREACGKREIPLQKTHRFPHHGEGMEVLLAVVDDFYGDLGSPEATELQETLR